MLVYVGVLVCGGGGAGMWGYECWYVRVGV